MAVRAAPNGLHEILLLTVPVVLAGGHGLPVAGPVHEDHVELAPLTNAVRLSQAVAAQLRFFTLELCNVLEATVAPACVAHKGERRRGVTHLDRVDEDEAAAINRAYTVVLVIEQRFIHTKVGRDRV